MSIHRLRTFCAGLVAVALLASCADTPATAPSASRGELLGFRPNTAPSYISCPATATQTTTGLIGPLGGVLSLGGTVVNIPADAVPTLTTFVMTIPASRYMKVDVTAVNVEHYVFRKPISVTIDYARCPASETDGKSLAVWYVAPILDLPLENMGGVNDAAARTITFTTPHLSGYVIAD